MVGGWCHRLLTAVIFKIILKIKLCVIFLIVRTFSEHVSHKLLFRLFRLSTSNNVSKVGKRVTLVRIVKSSRGTKIRRHIPLARIDYDACKEMTRDLVQGICGEVIPLNFLCLLVKQILCLICRIELNSILKLPKVAL